MDGHPANSTASVAARALPETASAGQVVAVNAPARPSRFVSWPRTWELTLAFILGICAVLTVQSAWKLLQPPTPLSQATAGIDLNAADAGTLRQLPGVGPHLAARIVDHRQKHGPFQRVDDLREVHGIGPATLERLRMVVMVTPGQGDSNNSPGFTQPLRSGPKSLPVEPIDLNTASLEQLMTLPSIGPAMAERIIASRTSQGPFQSVDDLTRIRGIKSKTLEKLLPYITVKKDGKGAS